MENMRNFRKCKTMGRRDGSRLGRNRGKDKIPIKNRNNWFESQQEQ